MTPRRRLFRFPRRTARRIRADVDEELRFHLDMRVQALVDAGATPEEAEARALREFGDLDDARQYIRRVDTDTEAARRRSEFMSDLRTDIGYAFRQLRAAPLFALTAVLTLALGIGANSAIFTVVDGVLLKPLPFPQPDRLVRMWQVGTSASEGNQDRGPVSAVDLDDWRSRRRVLADLGGYFYGENGQSGTDYTGNGEPQHLSAAFVTPGFWTTLSVAPRLGRVPRDEEMVRGANDKLVVLSHAYWQRQFGGAANVIGQHMMLGGVSHEIIGVMPPSFRFPSPHVDVYIPYSTIPDDAIPRVRPNRVLDVVGRLRPGATVAQADAEVNATARALAEQYPEDRGVAAARAEPLQQAMVGKVRTSLLVLLGAVGFVLLIAAVNLAGLFLARATARERELAIRVALGAGRGRIVRQLLTETIVLASIGGTLGVGVAYLGTRVLVGLTAGQLPRSEDVRLDARVLLFTIAVSLLTGIIFGLLPALRVSSPELNHSLREGSRGSTRGTGGLRNMLVVTEVALAVVLVAGAGLMARSFLKLLEVDLGFATERRVVVNFSLSSPQLDAMLNNYRAMIDKARAVPGVLAAGAIRDIPFKGDGEPMSFMPPGMTVARREDRPKATRMFATDGLLKAMGIPLIAGRDFTPQDRRFYPADYPKQPSTGAPLVVIVNQALARQYYPGQNPVGRSIILGDTTHIPIVGLVGDVRQGSVDERPTPRIYFTPFQIPRGRVNLVAHVRGDAGAITRQIVQAVHSVDPQQTITTTFPLGDAVGEAVARPRLLTVLLGLFGAMGLVLGALGIYGVLAYLVGQRTREIGVRLALGARPHDVLGMVIGRGLRLAGVGVVAGIAGAFALTRVMQGVLYGVTPTDPVTFGAVIVALLGVATFASWIPALRATRVDPLVAIRAE